MSSSYLSTDSAVQALEIKVQEIVVKLSDNQVCSQDVPGVLLIDVGQTISEVRAALFLDDSAATLLPVVAANQVIAGSTVSLTLSATMAAADAVILDYVIVE